MNADLFFHRKYIYMDSWYTKLLKNSWFNFRENLLFRSQRKVKIAHLTEDCWFIFWIENVLSICTHDMPDY